jgi:hypothetical protein
VDLSGTEATTAAEIRRLGRLMESGNESPEQFAQLVRLLHGTGCCSKAEFLLRRNLETVADGALHYRELYGTEKAEAFAAAIEAFAEQFSLTLESLIERGFLDRVYRTFPQQARFDELRLMSEPCEVRFDYASQEAVEADVSSLSNTQYVILRWVGGVWKAADESTE